MELSALSSLREGGKGGEDVSQLEAVASQWNTSAGHDVGSDEDAQKEADNWGVPPLYPRRSSTCNSSSSLPTPDGNRGSSAEDMQEKHLVELLHKASQIIKEERARAATLQRELDELRQSRAAFPTMQQLQQENKDLKKELSSMREQFKKSCSSDLQHQNNKDQKPLRSSTSLTTAGCGSSVSSTPSASHTPLTPFTTNVVVGRCYSDAQHRKRQSISLRQQRLRSTSEKSGGRDSTDSQHLREPLPSPSQRSKAKIQSECKQKQKQTSHEKKSIFPLSPRPFDPQKNLSGDTKADGVGVLPQPLLKPSLREEIWGDTLPHDGKTAYHVGMITRLRRAMAPPPRKEELGEVIHAMVQELLRESRQRGLDLNLKRQAPCVYLCELGGATGKRKKGSNSRIVHLSIDSGRLTVKLGGGHENFLEYLGRYQSLGSV